MRCCPMADSQFNYVYVYVYNFITISLHFITLELGALDVFLFLLLINMRHFGVN